MVAESLALANDSVHVWAPQYDRHHASHGRVELHRVPGHFGPVSLSIITRAIKARPGAVLLQYVPHAFGFKAMNLPFCLWLNFIRQFSLVVMFHEVAFPRSREQPFRHNLLASMNRFMARLVCRSATKIMVSSQRWEKLLRQLGTAVPISWVPVPSTIPVTPDVTASMTLRQKYASSKGLLIGHFANYCDYSVAHLSRIAPSLLREHTELAFLLLGAKSDDLRRHLLTTNPDLSGRVHATGALTARDLSSALGACDLMVQPYPDGVSTRRSSTSVLLAHGCAVVTTEGISTEKLWSDSSAVSMVPVNNDDGLRRQISEMISSRATRERYQRAAQSLYNRRFALRHTIAALALT